MRNAIVSIVSLLLLITVSSCVSTSDLSETSTPLSPSPSGTLEIAETDSSITDGGSTGIVITAVGTGSSQKEAKSDALAALSGVLYSQVSSLTQIQQDIEEVDGQEVGNTSSFSERIAVSTDLPILGASYTVLPKQVYDENSDIYLYQVEAILQSTSALPLYQNEITSITRDISRAESEFPEEAGSIEQEKALRALYDLYSEFEKLSYVALILGAEQFPPLERSVTSIEMNIRELEGVIDSYAKAARSLMKDVSVNGVYVYPAKLNNSGGVTEFAEQLSYAMSESLGPKGVSDPGRAEYFLFGSYTLKDDGKSGMYMTYRLEDSDGDVLSTSMIEIPPRVYAGQRFVPVAYDFQKKLERGDTIDTDFSVDIRINGMKDYLSFHKGDDLTIEVKASDSCYFYAVGYVFNELNEKFSYLFPLNLNAVGKDMFVYRVSPEEVNKWIIINPTYNGNILPIQIIEPYGVEMLQVYASTEKDYQKFLDTVPGFRKTKDYYLVSDDPEEGLQLTRALNIKFVTDQASEEVKKDESFVSFKSGR